MLEFFEIFTGNLGMFDSQEFRKTRIPVTLTRTGRRRPICGGHNCAEEVLVTSRQSIFVKGIYTTPDINVFSSRSSDILQNV